MTTVTILSGLGYEWPSDIPAPTEFEFELVGNVRASASQFDGSVQTTEVPGARWVFTARWSILQGAEARAMTALAAKLRGGARRYLVPFFNKPAPQGTQQGAPTVNAAGTGGTTLALANCTIGKTFKTGDVWALDTGQVVMLDEDAVAATTSVLLHLATPIRTVPANGSVVEWQDPAVLMVSSAQSVRVPTQSGRQLKNVEIRFVEVFG